VGNFKRSDRVSSPSEEESRLFACPLLEDGLKTKLLNELVRACSAAIRSLQVNLRAASTISCLTMSCIAALGLSCLSAAAQDVRIEHVTIVSPERPSPLPDATVYVHNDRIVSISPARSVAKQRSATRNEAEVIDGHGLYLAPGLIDSHVHLGSLPGMTAEQEQAHPDIASATREQIPRSYLYFGFTTLIDLVSTPAAVAQWNAHAVHPDLYFCGGAPIVDGYPMNWVPKPQRYAGFPYLIVQRGDEASAPEGVDPATHTPEAVVSRMKADGALCVKSFYEAGFGDQATIPVPRLDTIRALVQAAHAAKMPVFLHANGSDAQAFALDAGVDIIAHGLWHWNGEPKTTSELTPAVKKILDNVLETKTGWQPTMQVLYGERDQFDPAYLSDPMLLRALPANYIAWCRSTEGQWFHQILMNDLLPKPLVESKDAAAQWSAARSFYSVPMARHRNTTNYLATHGARLLFGTDTPSAPTYANPPGLNGWMEMHRLVDAGLTPGQIFRAATIVNAQALGLDREIGTVQPGKRANLLLLRKDPTQTIEAYDSIVKVILRGRVIDRAALAANRTAD
jgi:imidazolonepropionase-like amidohydrolase